MPDNMPEKRFSAHQMLAVITALLFVVTGILFVRQEKINDEIRVLALAAEQKAVAINSEANQNIGSVKDELAKFKIKSAEDNAALEKIATSQKPVVFPPTVTEVVKNWNPVVAQIICEFRYTNGVLYARQSGSGTLIAAPDGKVNLVTNKHVVSDNSGYGPTSCAVKFPNTASSYIVKLNDITLSTKGSDVATIAIPTLSKTLTNLAKSKRNYCSKVPDTGDEIVILGYPSIGGANVTATEGIISGYEGSYYITSAKVEHGNSGGAAINQNDNCYLGIPTFVQAGQIESLARILKWQAF